ncbi:radical SAM protein [Puia sp. P3]|uniref:radical SAM protein n=1 Tax=Puia sp. P3 TaxID=3423952 RepID=UPI003D66B125
MAGCDVGCFWCDVKDSWDAGKHPLRQIDQLVGEAAAHPCRIAIITGGEPLMHDCTPLTTRLHRAGFATHIETSGSSPSAATGTGLHCPPKNSKTPSPKYSLWRAN